MKAEKKLLNVNNNKANKPFIITGVSSGSNAKAIQTTGENIKNTAEPSKKTDNNWNQKKKYINGGNEQKKSTTTTKTTKDVNKINKSSSNWWIIDKEKKDSSAPELLLSEGHKWFDLLPANINDFLIVDKVIDNNKSSTDNILEVIKNSHENELSIYRKFKATSVTSKSDEKWINDVIKSGTLSDKVAALALRVQESPPHNIESLDILITMANKKEQRTSQLALEALKDLFISSLLPDRKLNYISSYNISNNSNMNIKIGLLLYFEDCLKKRMEKIIEALELGLKSSVDFFKRLCLSMTSDLLTNKPEQEAKLLSIIVNKLGDPSSGVCSKSIELLKQIISTHSAMKTVVVREVRQFIYRPNIKLKFVFNGIIFLCQISLVKGDHPVASQLVECYMSLFEKTVKEGELGSRLLSALLTGVNKAFPFLSNTDSVSKYIDSLFQIVHTASSFTTSTQALSLLSHLAVSDNNVIKSNNNSESEPEIVKRYYRALYAKLLSDDVLARGKNTIFLNLLYRSIKRDHSEGRAMAFLKRLSVCASCSTPPIAAGLLFLVSEIITSRNNMKSMINQFEEHNNDAVDDDSNYCLLGNFDASKREPEFATKSNTPNLWEVSLLRHHYHPSVQAFSNSLLEEPDHKIHFDGDPTTQFSLMAFLNRFSYKNPKKQISDKISRKQPISEEPINLKVAQLLKSDSDLAVEPDKQFFFKYFSERKESLDSGKSRNRKKKTSRKDFTDSAGLEDGDDEIEMDKFADELAEGLMKDNNGDEDDDEFDEGDENEDDDLDNVDDTLEFDDFLKNNNKKKRKQTDEEFSSDDGSEVDFDAVNNDNDDDSDDGSYEGLVAYGDGEDDDDASFDELEEEEVFSNQKSKKAKNDNSKNSNDNRNNSNSKNNIKDKKVDNKNDNKKNKRAKVMDDDFADAADYEEEMDSIVRELQQYHSSNNEPSVVLTNNSSNNKNNKNKKTKNSKR